MTWSEDSIHRWLARGPRPRGLAGSRGHDAAVLAELGGRPVVCADQVVEGVHFLATASARAVGRKAACRALSDLAATAASPRALVCTLAAPRTKDEAWLRGVLSGVRAAAREHGADLVAGDLSSTPGPATVAVTALGAFEGRGAPPGRDRARAGELVVLTGAVGGSLLGRHFAIAPRLAAGRALHRAGAAAMMDVSDGLAWDLFRLARAAGVGVELELARIPVHADARRLARRTHRPPLDHALHDGEDHELLATLAPRAARRVAQELGFHVVGRVVRGAGLALVRADGGRERWTHALGGFEHGA
ncbi:MAG: thiamine-phosphate kinase [Planctomycetes bacterium]|nr:thiamine-phosphate kinase [Planctomycetota bacterium]